MIAVDDDDRGRRYRRERRLQITLGRMRVRNCRVRDAFFAEPGLEARRESTDESNAPTGVEPVLREREAAHEVADADGRRRIDADVERAAVSAGPAHAGGAGPDPGSGPTSATTFVTNATSRGMCEFRFRFAIDGTTGCTLLPRFSTPGSASISATPSMP
jgi:hypothetical protein